MMDQDKPAQDAAATDPAVEPAETEAQPSAEEMFDFGDMDPEQAANETYEALLSQIEELVAERDALKDQLMRALAEAENTRRRAERDRKDAEAYGGTKLARDLLSVHDNFDRALASADDEARAHAASLIEGVELTQRELLSAFSKHKIEKIAPEPGDKFDPNLHQAMFEAPIPGTEPGAVIEVMQSGFTISGRLLRPALVGVAKAAPAADEADQT